MANERTLPAVSTLTPYFLAVLAKRPERAAAVRKGIIEVGLRDLYPYVDATEALAFLIESQHAREKEDPTFLRLAETGSLYELLATAKPRVEQLENDKRLTMQQTLLHTKLNPFYHADLETRAAQMPQAQFAQLRERLLAPVAHYFTQAEFNVQHRYVAGPSYVAPELGHPLKALDKNVEKIAEYWKTLPTAYAQLRAA